MEVKPGYKQTEVGVIPEAWRVSTIGTLASTSSGATPPRAMGDRYFTGGRIPWVKTLDLNNAELRATDEQVTRPALVETSLQVYPPGSVLVAMYGGYNQIGRTGLLLMPATINQALTAIQPRFQNLDSNYLLRVLNYRIGYWKTVASSSRKDPNITGKDVRDFPLAVPPITEQEAIAEALSDANALIDSLEQLLAKKRQIKQGAMQELLTGKKRLPGFSREWEVRPFDSVLTRVNIKAHQIQASDYRAVGRWPVVDQGKEPIIGYSDDHDRCFLCPKGGVIVFGDHTCIIKFVDFDFLIGADGTQVLQTKGGQNTQFHALQLQHNGVQPTGYNRHFKFLKEREFLTPALPEQIAIATLLSDMDAEITALDAKLVKARALKQGMMQELLTGRIRLV